MTTEKRRAGPLKRTLAMLIIVAAMAGPSAVYATCHTMGSPMMDAISNINWDDAFPITIMGMPIGGNTNPPDMYSPPTCLCPSDLFGYPILGIGLSFWLPMYIADMSNEAGCMQALGDKMLSGYEGQNSGNGEAENNRRQIHWYKFPLFSILQMFISTKCTTNMGFDLAYVTEIDPIWQDDLWSALFSPESQLTANPIARLACAVDAIAADFGFPMTPMFWCQGADSMYPMTGNSNVAAANEDVNHKALGQFLFRQHRIGMLWKTVGPDAMCSATYSPILPKGQYRLDPVWPQKISGSPIYVGKKYMFWQFVPPPVSSYPTHESAVDVLWRGTQCCINF